MSESADAQELNHEKQAFSSMRTARSSYDEQWQTCARFASPRDSIFTTRRSPGQNLRTEQFHSGAEIALDRSASYFKAFTTPDGQRYHGLQDSSLGRTDKEANLMYDEIENILFKYRYVAEAKFSSARYEAIRSMDGFGNGIMYIERGPSEAMPIRYRHCHLSQCYMTVDNFDVVNGMYYYRDLTPQQIADEYGADALPDKLLERLKNPATRGLHGPENTFAVVHSVTENKDYDPQSRNKHKKRFKSCHFLLDEDNQKGFLRKGGYDTFPYAVVRDSHTPDEIYGRGKLQKVLSEIKLLNQMKKTYIQAGHNAVAPTLLMRDDSSINPSHIVPEGLAVGGLDSQGRPTVAALDRGSNVEISDVLMASEEEIINRVFHLDTYVSESIGDNRDRVTATEITARMQEQVRIIGPQASRDEAEFLGPMITRELDILDSWGLLPASEEEEIDFDIIYRGALSLAQKSDEVVGANRTAEAVLNSAQADPTILKAIDWYEYTSIIHAGNGAPASMMMSREEYQAAVTAEQEQQAQQMMIENASGMAQAGNTLLEGNANAIG